MSGKRPFANTPAFYAALGWFYAVWSRTELAIDCAIWKASGTGTAERAHERAARTKFSEKCTHLRTLLDRRKIPNCEKATTSIALETSKGDLPLALGLGFVLISLSVLVATAAFSLARWNTRVPQA